MRAEETELRLAWEWAAGRSRPARQLLAGLIERHRQPHRHYHGLRHVVWVLRHVDELAADEPVADHGALVVAACYHDAVYLGRPGDDERASAALARRELPDLLDVGPTTGATSASTGEARRHTDMAPWTPGRIERVAQLVLATAHLTTAHLSGDDPERRPPVDDIGEGFEHDVAVLLDADLAVLGAPPAGYLDYVRGVRAEHPELSQDAWRTGRAAVLRSLLARPVLYRTPTGQDHWEARARANLTAELAGLEPQD